MQINLSQPSRPATVHRSRSLWFAFLREAGILGRSLFLKRGGFGRQGFSFSTFVIKRTTDETIRHPLWDKTAIFRARSPVFRALAVFKGAIRQSTPGVINVMCFGHRDRGNSRRKSLPSGHCRWETQCRAFLHRTDVCAAQYCKILSNQSTPKRY